MTVVNAPVKVGNKYDVVHAKTKELLFSETITHVIPANIVPSRQEILDHYFDGDVVRMNNSKHIKNLLTKASPFSRAVLDKESGKGFVVPVNNLFQFIERED